MSTEIDAINTEIIRLNDCRDMAYDKGNYQAYNDFENRSNDLVLILAALQDLEARIMTLEV